MFKNYSIGFDNKKLIDKNRMVDLPDGEYRAWYENVNYNQAINANKIGFGVFGWVNEFKNNIRKKENLSKVNYWYADIDGLSTSKLKKEFINTSLKKIVLLPTKIIESKNGFHIYWKANSYASTDCETFELIGRGINQTLGIESVFDCTRVLRVPNTIHSKNPDDKFKVRLISSDDRLIYDENEMLDYFKYTPHRTQKIGFRSNLNFTGEDFFEDLQKSNQAALLEKLSGSEFVNGEVYEFKRAGRGHFNIIVNGEETGAFVDSEGMLGSHGQPVYTVAQWLMNTGNFSSWGDVIKIIKSLK